MSKQRPLSNAQRRDYATRVALNAHPVVSTIVVRSLRGCTAQGLELEGGLRRQLGHAALQGGVRLEVDRGARR